MASLRDWLNQKLKGGAGDEVIRKMPCPTLRKGRAILASSRHLPPYLVAGWLGATEERGRLSLVGW